MNLSTSFGTWEAGLRRETQTSRGAGRGGGALAASTIPVTAMFNSMGSRSHNWWPQCSNRWLRLAFCSILILDTVKKVDEQHSSDWNNAFVFNQAQLENRLKDVAVLEEQMHKMLWGWKAELQAVPASSLLAETSSLESIDTWSGFAVKMMRMMML
ncbi:unnamed protein product [Sphagnum jensenii]|uniref:Uncharacterized protein n=1 Tax=Sphagnum jensenii TaxID=128206 RepID=A0ABP1A5A9_9BRYO